MNESTLYCDKNHTTITERKIKFLCKKLNLTSNDLVMLRHGENIVLRDSSYKNVFRINNENKTLCRIISEIKLLEFLEKINFPSIRLSKQFNEQPLTFEQLKVSVWKYENTLNKSVDNYESFGKLLKNFHNLNLYNEAIPTFLFNPLENITKQIEIIKSLKPFPTNQLDLINKEFEYLKSKFPLIKSKLGHGLIHGDFHSGNILVTKKGPIMCDFESFCYGAYEYDLIPLAVSQRRFYIGKDSFNQFTKGYGYNVTNHNDFETLLRLRELSMITWLSQKYGASAEINNEISRRINSINDGGNILWKPF